MTDRRRLFLLIFIMLLTTAVVGGTAVVALYRAAFEQQRERLVETAQSQARLLEAVARFDAEHTPDFPGGSFAATLGQMRDGHERFEGFGETGEFVLAKLEDGQIVFLLRHRHFDLSEPKPVPFSSKIAEPMRRALSGESGTVVGLDYRGETVLAAHEPVREGLGMGIVAKIDLAEIHAPFITATALAGGAALALAVVGALLFLRIGNPLIERLEENERKYRTLFESATEGVGLVAEAFEECNEQMCRLLLCEREDIVGHSLADISPPAQPDGRSSVDAARERMQAALYETPQFFYWQHQRKDGSLMDADLSMQGLDIGGRRRLLLSMRDITERKQAEEALKERSQELERSNADLEQFAYVASHDMQEPLRMISGYTQLLAKRYKGRLDTDADDFIGFAVDGASRMQRLIKDLLVYSRVDMRGAVLEPTDVEVQLDGALANLRLRIEESGAVISRDPLPTVMADPMQLLRVLQNIMSNAVKFRSAEAPRIHVSARRQGQEWVFSVRDNGIGIAPEYQQQVFMAFRRLHGPQRYPGSGIGLAVCKKVVDRHSGRIWIEPQPGKGSIFYFTMPAVREGAQ